MTAATTVGDSGSTGDDEPPPAPICLGNRQPPRVLVPDITAGPGNCFPSASGFAEITDTLDGFVFLPCDDTCTNCGEPRGMLFEGPTNLVGPLLDPQSPVCFEYFFAYDENTDDCLLETFVLRYAGAIDYALGTQLGEFGPVPLAIDVGERRLACECDDDACCDQDEGEYELVFSRDGVDLAALGPGDSPEVVPVDSVNYEVRTLDAYKTERCSDAPEYYSYLVRVEN